MSPTEAKHRRGERGSAMLAVMVMVVICGALAFAAIGPALARHREAQSLIQRERAFQIAEAGVDWAIADVRANFGDIPTPSTLTMSPDASSGGVFTLTYTAGDANGLDDDNDGVVDNSLEDSIVQIVSTGTVNEIDRTIRVLLRPSIDIPPISAAVQFNVENPILDLKGHAFSVSGTQHLLDASEDALRPPLYGIAAPTAAANLEAQIGALEVGQIVGLGGTPSVGYAAAIDLDTLVEQAKSAATVRLASGTHAGDQVLGSPTPDDAMVVLTEGDVHLSGKFSGAGILVVDGDLTTSGEFLWTGIVIVRGRATFAGGGAGDRVVGSMIIGEEIKAKTNSSKVVLTGTVDLLYSVDAMELAQRHLAVMTVLSWQETAKP